jgi:hypothetical protein
MPYNDESPGGVTNRVLLDPLGASPTGRIEVVAQATRHTVLAPRSETGRRDQREDRYGRRRHVSPLTHSRDVSPLTSVRRQNQIPCPVILIVTGAARNYLRAYFTAGDVRAGGRYSDRHARGWDLGDCQEH